MTAIPNPLDIPAAYASAPIPKVIEWENAGESHKATVYFKPLSWYALFGRNEEGQPTADLVAQRLSESLCNEKGEPLYSKADIKGETGKPLCMELSVALVNAFNEAVMAGKP